MWRDDIREVLAKRADIDRELLDGQAAVGVPCTATEKKKAQPRRKAGVV